MWDRRFDDSTRPRWQATRCYCPPRISSLGTYLPISNLPIAARCTSSGPSANRSVRYTLMLVALMIGTSTALFPWYATGMTGAAMLIALWGFAFGAFPACASIWMFVVAPKDVERGMPLFVALFQVIIALGSFFGGQIVDQLGSSVLLSLATALVGCGFVTVLVLGRNVTNSLAAQPS